MLPYPHPTLGYSNYAEHSSKIYLQEQGSCVTLVVKPTHRAELCPRSHPGRVSYPHMPRSSSPAEQLFAEPSLPISCQPSTVLAGQVISPSQGGVTRSRQKFSCKSGVIFTSCGVIFTSWRVRLSSLCKENSEACKFLQR